MLLIMGLLIAASLTIFGKFGIAKSAKAEVIALYATTIALIMSIYNIIISFSPQQSLNSMIPIIPQKMDWNSEAVNQEIGKELKLDEEHWAYAESSQTTMSTFINEMNLDSEYASFDGLTSVFVALTAIITPIAILASEKRTEMLSSLLLVEALLLGAFVTLDFVTFYALFESVLIPMFFLIGGTGSGTTIFRTSAAYRLFIYTLAGSVLMLLSLITIYLETGTLNWYHLVLKCVYTTTPELSLELGSVASSVDGSSVLQGRSALNQSLVLFPLIFIAFAVKVPMIPVHLWLPEAHTIAPTPGSMILAALLLKLGGYGILRWLMPIFPEASIYYSPVILVIAAISTTFASLTCLRQIDVKRIVAYSSIVHMNICIYSLFTLNPLALKGAIFEMFSHGIISTGMFFLIGTIYNRHYTRVLKYFRGLALTMPLFATVFFIFVLANSAVPLTCGFIGEFVMLSGSMASLPVLTLILTLSTIVNAAYNIWLFNRMCFGGYSPYLLKTKDLTRREAYVLSPLVFYIFFLGLSPNFLFMLIH